MVETELDVVGLARPAVLLENESRIVGRCGHRPAHRLELHGLVVQMILQFYNSSMSSRLVADRHEIPRKAARARWGKARKGRAS